MPLLRHGSTLTSCIENWLIQPVDSSCITGIQHYIKVAFRLQTNRIQIRSENLTLAGHLKVILECKKWIRALWITNKQANKQKQVSLRGLFSLLLPHLCPPALHFSLLPAKRPSYLSENASLSAAVSSAFSSASNLCPLSNSACWFTLSLL